MITINIQNINIQVVKIKKNGSYVNYIKNKNSKQDRKQRKGF